MRPAKVILIIDADEIRMSITRCVLLAHKFRLISAKSPGAAKSVRGHIDCIVAYWAFDPIAADRLARKLRAPLMVVAPFEERRPESIIAGDVLLKGECLTAIMLERIKILTARKRGPAKGYKRPPKPEPALNVSEAIA